jgi:hypothetical protein
MNRWPRLATDSTLRVRWPGRSESCEHGGTRHFDEPGWKTAMNRSAGTETACDEVGYVPP